MAKLVNANLFSIGKPISEKKIQPGSLKGPPHQPSSKAKPGEGGRFKALKKKLTNGVKDPGALAATIGRAKHGKAKFQKMAAKGKKG